MSQNENSAFAIESNSIDYVDPSQRHGKVRDLFTLWFCTNIAPLAVITGAMSMLTFNLSLISALVAICCGHFFGAVILRIIYNTDLSRFLYFQHYLVR